MSDIRTGYIEAFQKQRAKSREAARRAAIARFGELGLPTRRAENWRFTNLRPLEQRLFPPAPAGTVPAATLPPLYRLGVPSHRFVLVNGRFAPALSDMGDLPLGVSLRPLAESAPALAPALDAPFLRESNPFLALNAAFFEDGFDLSMTDVVAGEQPSPPPELDRPIEILHLAVAANPVSLHTRNRLCIPPGRRCTIVETFAGSGPYWTNAVLEIAIGDGAALRHIVLQDEGKEAVHLGHRRIRLGAGARYDGFTLALGSQLSRQDTIVTIEGERAECLLNGAYLLRGSQEATIATLIDHAAPGSATREVFKGVVADRAHGVFQGKIVVRQAAQKTDAHQLNKNLLLGRQAVVDTKPELEIYADDVKCSHGAAIGDLDENALFYLRARGLTAAEARRMLIDAFAGEAIDLVADGAARSYLRRHLERWLAAREE
ncbi:MAG TPA: Fe-S cluster assembly protein SufD [Stellaceae bacterium]|nr:Fe-S cluster assembly protein SufD [Stellaceae bacterium]